MLGLSSNLITSAYRRGLAYVRDGLKLYMPYRGANHSEVKFVGSGSTSFDGTDDYILCGDHTSLDITDDLTMMCWVKPSVTTTGFLMGRDDGSNRNYFLYVDGSTKFGHDFYVSNSNQTVTSTTDVVANTWYHVAVTRVKATGEHILYINGVAEDTDTDSTSSIDNDDVQFSIGARDDGSLDFTGLMKNVAVWNRALTATEIQNVMYKTYDELSGRLTSNLVSWWALETEHGDHHASNDGTNVGSTLNTDIYGGDTPVIPRAIDNAPTVQADGIGIGSASFDGTDDYITIANNSDIQIAGDMSVAFWLKRADSPAADGIITKRDGGGTNYQIDGTAADKIRFFDGTATASIGTSNVLGEWTHYAFTIDSGEAGGSSAYVNGVKDTLSFDTGTTLTVGSNDANLRFGNNEMDSNFYNGNLCQVGIWTKIMTQAQVLSVMEKTYDEFNAEDKTNLVSYWALDVNANDSHGSNNGTLS